MTSRFFIVRSSENEGVMGQIPCVLCEMGCCYEGVIRREIRGNKRKKHVSYDNSFGCLSDNPKRFCLDRHCGLILLGDGDVVDEQCEDERRWVEDAKGKGVLGICLGAQVLAYCYNGGIGSHAPIRREKVVDKGLVKLALTEHGRADPVLNPAREANPEMWFYQEHRHIFELPSNASDLAWSANDNETRPTEWVNHSDAFRIRDNVYGLGFHPEPTAEMLGEWLKTDEEPEKLMRVANNGRKLLEAWVEIVKQRK